VADQGGGLEVIFDLDMPKDCERLSVLIVSLQHEGVKFYVTRDENSAGLSRYATLHFGKKP
jgi:hypothetical protein